MKVITYNNYGISTPEAGDDDSVQNVGTMLTDISAGFLPKETRDAIVDGSFVAANATNAVNATNAETATNAVNATTAATASKVAHSLTIGSTVFDGSADKTASLGVRDIAGASKVYYGTDAPSSHTFSDTPQVGDIYIRIY